jgi:hypothetical protein
VGGGGEVDSIGSGQKSVVDYCDEPSGSGATELVNIYQPMRFKMPEDTIVYKLFGHQSVRSLWRKVWMFVKIIPCDVRVVYIVLTRWLP